MLTSIWCAFLNVYFSTLEPSGMAPNKAFSEVRFIPRESLVDMLLLIACWMGSCQCQWQLSVGCQCQCERDRTRRSVRRFADPFPLPRGRAQCDTSWIVSYRFFLDATKTTLKFEP